MNPGAGRRPWPSSITGEPNQGRMPPSATGLQLGVTGLEKHQREVIMVDKEQPKYSALEHGNQPMKLLATSSNELSVAKVSLCSLETATEAAQMVMGSFADHGKIDPEIFLRQLARCFMDYPEPIAIEVAKDIAFNSKWLPSLYEINEALMDLAEPAWRYKKESEEKWHPPSTPNQFREDPPELGPLK